MVSSLYFLQASCSAFSRHVTASPGNGASQVIDRELRQQLFHQVHRPDMVFHVPAVDGDLAVQEGKGLSRRQTLRPVFLCLAQHDDRPDRMRFIVAHLRGSADRPALGVPAAVNFSQQRPVSVDRPAAPVFLPEIRLGRFSRLRGRGEQNRLAVVQHIGAVKHQTVPADHAAFQRQKGSEHRVNMKPFDPVPGENHLRPVRSGLPVAGVIALGTLHADQAAFQRRMAAGAVLRCSLSSASRRFRRTVFCDSGCFLEHHEIRPAGDDLSGRLGEDVGDADFVGVFRLRDGNVVFAICFPGVYEIRMSRLGEQKKIFRYRNIFRTDQSKAKRAYLKKLVHDILPPYVL